MLDPIPTVMLNLDPTVIHTSEATWTARGCLIAFEQPTI
jgi:hypothetical protein